jgi:Flp pilus assembly protein TadD
MAARFKTRWPLGPLTNQVEVMMPSQLMDLISGFATNEPVVYLHPSSGFFFERFVDEPNGSIHRLVLRPDEQVSTPALADPVIAANEYIWQERWTNNLFQLALRTKETLQPASRPRRSSASWLGLGIERSAATPLLGSAYSKSLNYWGVQMQRHGRSEEAGVWFQRAIELNPDNLAARINREYNERCRQGDNSRLAIRRTRQQFSYLFSKFDNWWEVVSDNGPADEPTFLLQSGRILLATWNPRQATDAFARCVELAPRWLTPKLWLAQSCNSMQSFAAALTFTDELQASGDLLSGTSLAQLFRCRVTAMRGLGRTNEADAYMESFVGKHKEQFDVLSMAANLYAQNSQFEHELALLQKLVDREPTNLELLSRKGLAELRLVRFENAIVTLTTALSLEPANENARLLRAVAHLRAGHLDAARNDYLELLKNPSSSEVALFGLGGVAWRERDTNAIVEYYQRYLTNATPGSSRYSVALERLNQLNDD